jgi:hypothetical protein
LLHAEKDLREQADAWLTGVQNIVGALSQSFSKFMEGLQYHGKLSLRQTGKLSDYEIVIEVGFRGDGEKAELSGSRHSGGERAVSTIMYLMALQQLTSAPFRVVDEVIRTRVCKFVSALMCPLSYRLIKAWMIAMSGWCSHELYRVAVASPVILALPTVHQAGADWRILHLHQVL